MNPALRAALRPLASAARRPLLPHYAAVPQLLAVGPTIRLNVNAPVSPARRTFASSAWALQSPFTGTTGRTEEIGAILGSHREKEELDDILIEDDTPAADSLEFAWEYGVKEQVVKDIDMAVAEDHHDILHAYDMYRLAQDPKDKRHFLYDLVRRIAVHSAAEEVVVYPELMNVFDRNAILRDHHSMKEMFARLETEDMNPETFDARLADLMDDFRDHVNEEDRRIMPALRVYMGASGMDTIREMGTRFSLATSVVPKHPLTKLLGAGTDHVHLAPGSVAAIYDKVKEVVREAVQTAESNATQYD